MIPLIVGSVAGALLGQKKTPKTAPLAPLDYTKAVDQTIAANQRIFEQGSALTSATNTYNQTEALRLMEIALPGFSQLQGSALRGAQSDLDNQYNLPPEIQANLQRKAAEMGVTRGTSGQFNQFSLLRDFGFNMVDYANAMRVRAMNTLQQITGVTPRVSPMSPMSMFLTPQSVVAQQARENEINQAIAQGVYNAKAAADNYNRQLWADAATVGIQGAGDIFSGMMKNALPEVSVSRG